MTMTARGFRSIIGHKDVIRHFQTAVLNSRISHAYLITGEPGSGKRMMADAFAETLLCENVTALVDKLQEGREGGPDSGPLSEAPDLQDVDACLDCISCKKVLDGNHPDLIYVTHEKPNVISVHDIRTQVVGTVDILPYESRYKIYIIPEAEKMNQQAQNALLKTIEEPPAYVVILLLTSSPESLLATIHSRCVTLFLKPVSDRDVMDCLTGDLHMPDYEARVLTGFAQGNIGRAVRAVTDESFVERRDRTLMLIRAIHGMDTATMMEVIRLLKEDKDEIGDVFGIMMMWYRDVLLFKATRDVDQLIFTNDISTIRAQASASSYEGLQEILDAIDRCQVRLRANVSFELALELMLFTIKENCNA